MASYSSSSSLVSQSPHPWKYDVFISFRGEDTRRSFSSHLYDALCRKGLLTFIDDEELERGEEIAESLVQAIQESNVAVVVFSKDYASSTWCLDELVKIIECHETREQIIIPVFYSVDPSHIRKQSHDVATAFERHEQNPRNAHKIQNWRDALTMTANLSGLDSKAFRYDHMLISKIVEDMSKKLKKSTVCDGDELLVGVDSHFMRIKNRIMSIEGLDVCIIGIWGMGGIGKTTIAEFIFKRLSSEFEGCCFLKNVREGTKVRDLKKELISQLLSEKEPNVYAFSKTRLGHKRALIVLDDVDDSQQLDSLIGDPCWFGSQSVIIITGRDKQVLGRRNGFLYEVEPLNKEAALRLFSKSAFKQNYPRNNYESLSSSIVKYAQGNPLALKVLGSSLSGKTTKEWENALEKLLMVPNKKIQDVLQIGFDGLDRMEKDIFLHIACFFKGDIKDVVMRVFEFDADIIDSIISVLVDKCFLTISGSILEMHDLMQEMGKEIVRQESKHPNERSRLWDAKDVFKVLAEDKDENIGYSVASQLTFGRIGMILHRFCGLIKTPLDIYGRQLGKVTYLNLANCKNISHLPNSRVGFLEALENLTLWGCKNLNTFPEVSSNIKHLDLSYTAIEQIPSSLVEHLGKLKELNMPCCNKLESLPSNFFNVLTSLITLNLEKCPRLKKLPEISENINSLETLYFGGTDLDITSSIGNLKGLKILDIYSFPTIAFLPQSGRGLISYCLPTIPFVPKSVGGLTWHHMLGTSSLKNLTFSSLNLMKLPGGLQLCIFGNLFSFK